MIKTLRREILKATKNPDSIAHLICDEAAGYWSAYFTDELSALRVYHHWGGSETFNVQRVRKLENGQLKGCYGLTTFNDNK
jgi:hypothetical protein